MDINNPTVIDYLLTDQGDKLKVTVLDIGTWDMDTVPNVFINHGLSDITKILSVTVSLILDTQVVVTNLNYLNNETWGNPAGVYLTTTQVKVSRALGGVFDNGGWSATVLTRGSITILYLE